MRCSRKRMARPAGFEPATRGLEVRICMFATVRQGPQNLINEPNLGYALSPMFTGVRLGCRQNCRQHQLILAVDKARQITRRSYRAYERQRLPLAKHELFAKEVERGKHLREGVFTEGQLG